MTRLPTPLSPTEIERLLTALRVGGYEVTEDNDRHPHLGLRSKAEREANPVYHLYRDGEYVMSISPARNRSLAGATA